MKKVFFTNKIFLNLLISYLIILIVYNSYAELITNTITGIIPIIFEIILLILIFNKHRYAKMSILIWAAITLIIGYGFEVVATLFDYLNNYFDKNLEAFNLNKFIFNIIQLMIGVLILHYTKRTVIIAINENFNQPSYPDAISY